MKKLVFILSLLFTQLPVINAQTKEKPFSFAFLNDVHVAEDAKSVEDFIKCIDDVNNNKEIEFAILAGDITEFGNDEEIELAKSVIDMFEKPYYIIAGNHDAKWSESGCNTFVKTFGYEEFNFEKNGIRFIGTNSGPNMRMAPALVPHESVIWLDSLANTVDPKQPVFFINHYPMDTSVLNYSQVLDAVKKMNTQFIIHGHWHIDRAMVYDGIPALSSRSTQAVGRKGPGYNVVTVNGSTVTVKERVVEQQKDGKKVGEGYTASPWYTLRMSNGKPYDTSVKYPRPNFDVNNKYTNVKAVWKIQDNTDIGSAATISGNYVVYANTSGEVKALDATNGNLIWSYKTDGKIFSSPAISGKIVVVGSTDNYIYALSLKDGSKIWSVKCNKSVLGSPTIYAGKVFIGASDGVFRALNLKNGKEVWSYDKVKGFMEAKPFVDKDQVVIGDWANTLYSFSTKSGKLMWEWKNKGSRMLSPAAVWPIKANGKIFFATPQRLNYALNAKTGEQLWVKKGGRESIGLSPDKSQYYVKIMKDSVASYSTVNGEQVWKVNCNYGYEIAPTSTTSIAEGGLDGKGLIFVPTDKGDIYALNVKDGSLAWKHKLSIALINYILPLGNSRILVSTMDGIVAILEY